MELFTVQRYTEDNEEKHDKNESAILEKLLQKAEKRKRKKEKSIINEITEEIQLKQTGDSQETSKTDVAPEEVAELLKTEENDAADFEVLGEDVNFTKRQKVDMVLPTWLAHPTIISTSITKDNEDIDTAEDAIANINYLAPHIRQSLKELNITRLFPVQSAVIPWILEAHSKPVPFRPRDLCVSSPTGSGKTLAFAAPVVQLLSNRVERKIRALVVLPVAELALQVYKVFKKLCEKTDLTVCLLTKQVQFALEQQKLVQHYKGKYHSKMDIIITTPGRLVDHLHATKGFCLKSLKFLIIDEADRIMDAVFQNWLYHLDAHVRATSDQLLSGRAAPLCYYELQQNAQTQPHKLLFSATLSQDPEKLQNLRLFQPKLFTSVLTNLEELHANYVHAANELKEKALPQGEFIGKYTTPAELTEKYCITEARLKPLTLYSLIKENGWKKFLCFTNSTESCSRLAFVLKELCGESLKINDISSAINHKERASVLSKFSIGEINGLVCSDALARGIDIPMVDIVVSYDPPRHIKTYIHRVGRTARAGAPGTAITLLTQKELDKFNQTLSEAGKKLTDEIVVTSNTEEENAKNYRLALDALRNKVEIEKHNRIILKTQVNKRANLHKDPAAMTLMEKMQMKATEEIQKNIANSQVGKRRKIKLSKKERKMLKESANT